MNFATELFLWQRPCPSDRCSTHKHSHDFGTQQVELTCSAFCLLGLWGSTRDHFSCSMHHSIADAVLETAVLVRDIQQLYQNIRSANSSKAKERVQLMPPSQGSFPYHKLPLRDKNRRSFPISFCLLNIHLDFLQPIFRKQNLTFSCNSVIFPKAISTLTALPTPSSTDATLTPEKPAPSEPRGSKTNPAAAPFGSRFAPMERYTTQREVWKAFGHPAKAQPRQGSRSGFTGAWPQGAFDLESSRRQRGRSVWGYTTCKDTGRCAWWERDAEGLRVHVWGACQQMAPGNHKSICRAQERGWCRCLWLCNNPSLIRTAQP